MELIVVNHTPHVRHVRVAGQLDSSSAQAFHDACAQTIDGQVRWLVLDCAHTVMISSMGAGMVIRLGAKLRGRSGGILLVAPKPQVREMIRLMGLDAVVRTYDSMAEATTHLDAVVAGEAT